MSTYTCHGLDDYDHFERNRSMTYTFRPTGLRFHNLLVVDWDFFFQDSLGSLDGKDLLFDWGHRETEFFIESASLWGGRASGFLRNNLPMPDTTGEEMTFWDRFRFAPDAKLYFADSNASAASTIVTGEPNDYFSQVWLYDAHHDSGYRQHGQTRTGLIRKGHWSCEDWMVLYSAIGAQLHMRYPTWKAWGLQAEPKPMCKVDRQVDNGKQPPYEFDRVFVCRSGAWVPPWLDEKFEQFIARAPVTTRECIHPSGEVKRRVFSMDDVDREMRQMQKAMEMFAAHQAAAGAA